MRNGVDDASLLNSDRPTRSHNVAKVIEAVNATRVTQASKDAMTMLILTASRGAEVLGLPCPHK